MAVQARTLELYRQLDLADAVVAAGYPNPAVNLWALGEQKAHIELQQAGHDLSPYPYVLIYPQDQHERLLIKALEGFGIHVERETELLDFVDHGAVNGSDDHNNHITARLRLADGSEKTVKPAT